SSLWEFSRQDLSTLLGPSSTHAGIAQLVERNLAKVEVASSRLVSRSKHQKGKLAVTCRASFFLVVCRRNGRVVMQRIANPCTSVRFRLAPPNTSRPAASRAFLFQDAGLGAL